MNDLVFSINFFFNTNKGGSILGNIQVISSENLRLECCKYCVLYRTQFVHESLADLAVGGKARILAKIIPCKKDSM